MNTTVSALQAVYVKVGGSLTDTYDGIADGAPVGGYSLTTDVLKAIYAKCGGSLSEVYEDIQEGVVSEYAQTPDAISAIGKVVEIGGGALDCDFTFSVVGGGLLVQTRTNFSGEVECNIPDGVTIIKIGSFSGTEKDVITKINMPDTVTEIESGSNGTGVFSSSLRLSEVNLSNNLQTIGDFAFASSSNLTSIVIPVSVTTIGQYSLMSVENIYFAGTEEQWGAITIGSNALKADVVIHYNYIPE